MHCPLKVFSDSGLALSPFNEALRQRDHREARGDRGTPSLRSRWAARRRARC